MGQRFSPLKAGGKLSASRENLKARAIEGHDNVRGSGGLSPGRILVSQNPGGFSLSHDIPIPFWARIIDLADAATTTLAADIGTGITTGASEGDTLLSFTDNGVTLPPGISNVTIDDEELIILAMSGTTTYAILARGANDTTPATHSAGATVTASVQGYTWQEQQQLGQGQFEDYLDGKNDVNGQVLAYETAKSITVAADSIVQLWPGYDNGQSYYLFSAGLLGSTYILAKVTASALATDSTTGKVYATYSWSEQSPTANGQTEDKEDGRSGSESSSPAYEANGNTVVQVGDVVRLFPGFVDDNLGQTYLFDAKELPIAAEVTAASGGGIYTCQERMAANGGTWTTPATARTFHAYERNLDATVTVGIKVLLWRGFLESAGTQEWVFDKPASDSSGSGAGGDLSYWRMAPISTYDPWYPAGTWPIFGSGYANSTPPANTMVAMPYISPRGETIALLAVRVNFLGNTGCRVRLGIYETAGGVDLRPGALVIDGGTVTLPNGTRSVPIGITLNPGKMYYFVSLFDSFAASPSLNILLHALTGSAYHGWTPFGVGTFTSNDTIIGWTASQAFGALPSNFPTPSPILTESATAVPVVAAQISA